ncbi:MAG: nitroreductase family protein [Candidatus Goldbacteria bacterium]|nr:nitroreductase family protein [Candidatus Goldiibacteriota bacterium]
MQNSNQYLDRNETIRSIRDRRSIRTFLDKNISDDDLLTILHAGHQAPSAHNQQSWKFIVLKDKAKNDLAAMVAERSSNFPKPSAVLLRMASRSIINAPVVVGVMNTGELIRRGTELFKIDKETAHDFFRIMEVQSSAASVQNMLIAATSLGLGTVWLGVLALMQKDVLGFLGEPEGEFVAIIPIGYPAKPGVQPSKHELDMVVKYL